MNRAAKSLIAIAAGALLSLGATLTAPTVAVAQFPNCWGCTTSPGYWVCVKAVMISGSYTPENCVATGGECWLYDTSCGPQDFGADGSLLNSASTLALADGDEPLIVVGGARGHDTGGVERSACTGAIVVRHIDSAAGAESRAASSRIVL